MLGCRAGCGQLRSRTCVVVVPCRQESSSEQLSPVSTPKPRLTITDSASVSLLERLHLTPTLEAEVATHTVVVKRIGQGCTCGTGILRAARSELGTPTAITASQTVSSCALCSDKGLYHMLSQALPGTRSPGQCDRALVASNFDRHLQLTSNQQDRLQTSAGHDFVFSLLHVTPSCVC